MKMDPEESKDLKSFSIGVSEHLYRKIDNHIRVLKHLDSGSQTKKTWLTNAITEKLDREKDLSPNNIPKKKHLSFKVESSIGKEVEKRVELIRNFRESFSIKAWVLDAILEKMDQEESRARKMIEDLERTKEPIDF